MFDQEKTGRFIAEARKSHELTQRQLAEKLGVSDKSVSKWETGKGMPDTSIIAELCDALQINVNELLSGEKLSGESYSGKAEENMMNLMKETENEKKSSKANHIGTLVGIAAMVVFLCLIGVVSGTRLNYYLDVESILAVVGLTSLMLAITGQFGALFKGVKTATTWNVSKLSEISTKEYAIMIRALTFTIHMNLTGGLLGFVVSIIGLLRNLSTPEVIGPNLSVALLTLFYAALFNIILLGYRTILEKKAAG